MSFLSNVLKKRFYLCFLYILIPLVFFCFNGCSHRVPPMCINDGKRFCVTNEWLFSERWYSCYKRGVSCMEGGCWEAAKGEFEKALRKRGKDGIWVLTYGMHRLPEYFPNRELGIVYYHLNDFNSADDYLTTSLDQFESSKAKYYLNMVRREILILTKEDREPPFLSLDPYAQRMAMSSMLLSGKAWDDTYIANIMIQVNDREPVSLMELSKPLSHEFKHILLLNTGENEISVKAIDLLGNETEKRISVIVDKEGPMIFFGEPEVNDPGIRILIKGALFDPSGIKNLLLNGERVALTKIDIPEGPQKGAVLLFQYPLSFIDWADGIIRYQAEDTLHNSTEGTIRVLEGKLEETGPIVSQFPLDPLRMIITSTDLSAPPETAPFRIAMASQDSLTISDIPRLQIASSSTVSPSSPEVPLLRIARRRSSPIRIIISNVPEESFEEEITAQIEILAQSQIREVYVNGESILSDYGLSLNSIFASVGRYLRGERTGRFSFPAVLKLSRDGENIIKVKVIDRSKRVWEEEKRIVRKIKQVRKLEERWRWAIPLLSSFKWGEKEIKENKEFTYQLMDAFITQERFNIIDTMNLPVLIDEKNIKNLHDFIEHPYLGLKKQSGILIDAFLFGYVHQSRDYINMFASLVDLETGEILATKDVFERMDSIVYSPQILQEHMAINCYALANKFKEHFPISEGKVISFNGDEIYTSICKPDGLKRGMKLIIFEDQPAHDVYPLAEDPYEMGNFKIIGEVRVKEVSGQHSLGILIRGLESFDFKNISKSLNDISKNLLAITR